MLERLNKALEMVETNTTEPVDATAMARVTLTSEHHFRRMFATLAGMPLAEYVRRRRLTLAGAEVLHGSRTLLEIAVGHGYGSTEAFSRAFRAMHGVSPGQARRTGAELSFQPRMTFRLTIEGSDTVQYRIVEKGAFRIVGPKVRVPIIHLGRNTVLEEFVRGLGEQVWRQIEELSDQEPSGVLAVTMPLSVDRQQGDEVDYYQAAATSVQGAKGMETLEVSAGTWVVFPTSGPLSEHPESLQRLWANAYGQWFPTNPAYRAVPGPEMLKVDTLEEGITAKAELWIPVERL